MKVDAAECTADLAGLDDAALRTLGEWERKFASKYGAVGRIVG